MCLYAVFEFAICQNSCTTLSAYKCTFFCRFLHLFLTCYTLQPCAANFFKNLKKKYWVALFAEEKLYKFEQLSSDFRQQWI